MPEAAHPHTSRRANVPFMVLGLGAFSLCALTGCANPGPPRPPSLRLPEPARALTADRIGDSVTLSFTLPHRTTDGLPIREKSLGLRVCRELEHTACIP